MREIKEKPKAGKGKSAARPALAPKQAAKLLKDKYVHQLDRRPEGADNETDSAVEQVEASGRFAVDEAAVHAHRHPAQRHTAKEKPRPSQKPEGEAATKDSAHAPKERTVQPKTRKAEISRNAKPPQRAAVPAIKEGQNYTPMPAPERPASQPTVPRSAGKNDRGPDRPQIRERMGRYQPKQREQHHQPAATARRDAAHDPISPRANRRFPQGHISKKEVALKVRGKAYTKAPFHPKTAQKAVTRTAGSTAQKRMTQQAVRQAQKAGKALVATFKRMVQAVTKAAAALAGSLIGLVGGGVLLIVMVVVVIIAAIANSPFGLFFAGEAGFNGGSAPGTVSVAEAVAQVNMEYNDRLEGLQAGDYDGIDVTGSAADWPDVLAVFASRYAAADDGVDVATLDADRVSKLTATFWDMTDVSSTVETIDHPDSDPDDDVDDSWTEHILHITVTPKTAADMEAVYGFTDYQKDAMVELLSDRAALSSLAGSLTITNGNALTVLNDLPDDLSTERRTVVETALTLYGKVNYFWGGKSRTIGWDNRWGQLMKVTADGSSTTGTYRPYGLDCSGYVDWVFYNATDGGYTIGHGGGAHAQHTYCTAISWDEARPGDLAFYPEDEHVGIICGRDEGGGVLIIHCASSANNVVITGISGFTSAGRPVYYGE